MTYLSVENFWKYQNADVWKKSKTHPPWFKHYVHRDRDLDSLPPVARLLFWELVGAATRYHNVLGSGSSGSEANLWESEADLNWIWAETRVEVEDIREWLPILVKGGWLSQTKTPRRSRKPSRNNLEDPRDQDIDKEEDVEEEKDQDLDVGLEAKGFTPRLVWQENDEPPDFTIPTLQTVEERIAR